MQRADLMWNSRQRDVDPGEGLGFFLGTKICRARFERHGNGVANFIEQFSNDRLFVFAERSHLLAARGDAAAFAEVLDARGLERLLVRRGLDLAQGVVAQLFERVSHSNVEALKRNTNVTLKRFNASMVPRKYYAAFLFFFSSAALA